MKVIDCFWDYSNLGKSTAEVLVDNDDSFDVSQLREISNRYEYTVVKVPVNRYNINNVLADCGFSLVEVQYTIEKELSALNMGGGKMAAITPYLDFLPVKDYERLKVVIDCITPDMFITDRIAIDPFFGREAGRRRYTNWIKSEYDKGTSCITQVLYKGVHVGFIMYRISGHVIENILNGIYPPFFGKGIGIITAASPLLFAKQIGNIEREITSISSNNIPVVKLYNYLNFKLLESKYVFVKHQSV